MAAVAYDAQGATELRLMARARRRHRAAGVDIFEGFYQAYLTAFACGVAVLLSSDAIGDRTLDAAQMHDVITRGPALIGLGIAIVWAVAVRSGARGGPLVLPAADVRHVLLAPVRRDQALRAPAIRQVRFSAFVGLIIGAGLGVLASHRLGGGGAPTWVPVGAAVGVAAGACTAGLGLLCSGRRVRPWQGLLIAAGLLAWSGVDVALGRATSPMGLLGEFALLPLKFRPASVATAAFVVVVCVAAVLGIGGLSIEQAERRATLASQIRFALTLQDLRTVVLLRRQLTQEQSRPRPWVRLGPLSHGQHVVWHRDVRGVNRWPAVRVVRLVACGMVAGAALAGTFAGTTPLIIVAALALFLAGLEALEPLAQDIDHPDLPSSTPTVPGQLRLAHAPVPLAVMVGVSLVGWATVLVMAAAGLFSVHLAVTVGAPMVVPAALLAFVGAVVSVVMEPPSGGGDFLPAEIAGVKVVLRAVWSPALVVIGLTPVLVARSALHHTGAHPTSPGAAALSASFLPLTVGILGLGWLRFREDIRQSFSMQPPPKQAQPASA